MNRPLSLAMGRASAASLAEELYCDWPPYLAYFKTTHSCADCGGTFVFSKDEQRHWYERLGFWVQSRPKQSTGCRAARRRRAKLNQRLQRAIENLDSADAGQLAEIASLLLQMDSELRAIVYLHRAKNRARTNEQRAEFAKQPEALNA